MADNNLRPGEGRTLETVDPIIAQTLIEVQMFHYFRQPCFYQANVSGSLFYFCHLHIPKCRLVGSLMLYRLRLRC